MSYSDNRGASYSMDVVASVGVNEDWTVESSDGVAFDLTGYSIIAVVKDDECNDAGYGNSGYLDTSITMTITDAENGMFDFVIPSTVFIGREGGRLTYELREVDPNGNDSALAYGYINVLERG